MSEQRVRWWFFLGVNPRPSILLHACLVSDKLLAQLIDKESLAFQQEKKPTLKFSLNYLVKWLFSKMEVMFSKSERFQMIGRRFL